MPGTDTEGDATGKRQRANLTGRAAMLALVVCLLAISLAYPLREYLAQRGEIADYRSQVAEQEQRVDELRRAQRRWQDPAYVEAQARERFGWVLPGETSYQVIDRNGKPLERSDELTDPDSVARQVPDPWWDKVYGTLEDADHPKKTPAPKSDITPPPRPPSSGSTPDP
jgi:cell division protein FtsB